MHLFCAVALLATLHPPFSEASEAEEQTSLLMTRVSRTPAAPESSALELFELHISGLQPKGANKRIPQQMEPRAGKLDHMQWLHVPKSGTSFISSIWGQQCGHGERPIDMAVDVRYSKHCEACYDFVLMERYPKDVYCKHNAFHKDFQTQHRPTTKSLMTTGGERTVGFFRKPSQRMISARKAVHVSGFSGASYTELRDECRMAGPENITCFARKEGVAGCITRMLTGGHCAEDPRDREGPWDQGMSRVPAAIEAMDAMTFVGLTDQWDESVCLFHLMFGGDAYTREFHDVHASAGHSPQYDESGLEGFVDEADEILYSHSKKLFEAQKAKYLEPGESACSLVLPSGNMDQDEIACQHEGMQCGTRDGVKFECGNCPHMRLGRLGLSSNVKVPCSEANTCMLPGYLESNMFSELFTFKDFKVPSDSVTMAALHQAA